MERILIIGCAGAGKSTLAMALGQKTGLPVVHLDKLFWKQGWVESTKEELDEKILRETQKDRWIMDGNYTRTLPMRLQRCDCVIFLDFPRWLCLLSVLKRVACNYGRVRPDMPEGCPERFDWEFLVWIWNFNKNNRAKILRALNNAPDVKWILLRNRKEVRKFLKQVASADFL